MTDVYAQDDTPTPTDENLYNTPTLAPTGYYGCSGTQPSGMYTVTPDPYWSFKCDQCVTKTPYYVFPTSQFPFNTTVTPTIIPSTPTVSPTPTSSFAIPSITRSNETTPQLQNQLFSFNISQLSWSPGSKWGVSGWNNSSSGHHKIGLVLNTEIFLRLQPGGYINAYNFKVINYGQLNFTICERGGINCTSVPGGSGGVYLIPSTQFPESTLVTIYKEYEIEYDAVTNSGADWKLEFFAQSAKNEPYGYENSQFLWQWGGLTPLGTPTPTPVVGYCDTVVPVGGGIGDEEIFNLPIFTIGWARCVNFGGWNISVEWFNTFFNTGWSNDVTVPGFQICIRPLHFGNLTILGLVISLDFFASIMAGVLLLRFILRS